MSSIAPHSLDTYVIQNSSFCITSDLLVQQRQELELFFFFQTVINFLYCFLNNKDYPLEPSQEAL